MKEYIVKASETLYYQATVKAESETEAKEKFNELLTYTPYMVDAEDFNIYNVEVNK